MSIVYLRFSIFQPSSISLNYTIAFGGKFRKSMTFQGDKKKFNSVHLRRVKGDNKFASMWNLTTKMNNYTGRARLIRSHSLARLCSELRGNSN